MQFKDPNLFSILTAVENKDISSGDPAGSGKKETSVIFRGQYGNKMTLTVQNNKSSSLNVDTGAGFVFDFRNFLTEAQVQKIAYTDAYGWHKTQAGTRLTFTYQGPGGQSLAWNQGDAFKFDLSEVSCASNMDNPKILVVKAQGLSGEICQQPMIHFLDPPTHPNNLDIRCDFEDRTTIPPVTGKNYAPSSLPKDVVYVSADPASKIYNSLNFYLANQGNLPIEKGYIKIWFDSADIKTITPAMTGDAKAETEAQNAVEKAACMAENQTIYDNYTLDIKRAYGNQLTPPKKNQEDPTNWKMEPASPSTPLLAGSAGTQGNYNRIELQFKDIVSFLDEGLTNLYISFEKMDNYNSAIFVIPIQKKRPEPQIAELGFLNSSLTIAPDEKARLKWRTFLVERVTLTYVDPTGAQKVLDSANQPQLSPNEADYTLPDVFQPDRATVVTLSAFQKAGDSTPVAKKSLTFSVTKAKPKILSFTGKIADYGSDGSQILLEWTTQNADNCFLNGIPCDSSGNKSVPISMNEVDFLTYSIQLKATNSLGEQDIRNIRFLLDPTPWKYFRRSVKFLAFDATGTSILVTEIDTYETTYGLTMEQILSFSGEDCTQDLTKQIFSPDFDKMGNAILNVKLAVQNIPLTLGALPNNGGFNSIEQIDSLKVTFQNADETTSMQDWGYYFYKIGSFGLSPDGQILLFPPALWPTGSVKFIYGTEPSKTFFYVLNPVSGELAKVFVTGRFGVGYGTVFTSKFFNELAGKGIDSIVVLGNGIIIFCSHSQNHHYYYDENENLMSFSGPTKGPAPVAGFATGSGAFIFQGEKSGSNWNLQMYYLDLTNNSKSLLQTIPLPPDSSGQIPKIVASPDGKNLIVNTGSRVNFFAFNDEMQTV